MLSYISGTLAEKTQNYAVVDVNGVGFKIYSSSTSLSDPKINCGENVTFHTFMYIKEGIMDLYGFSTKAELNMFELLISVNGVGAKGALAVLSLANTEKIAVSIVTDDSSFIKKAAGIGVKTAQRICLELKDKIANEALVPESVCSISVSGTESSAVRDATDALISLGYSRQEANKAVSSVANPPDDAEMLIKLALKNLF
ncbi:MAG: Holliday junction branch migration protein RuvA [Clostridia bacterium]|nr:Holliday junction branch migration protein RuvA [Clostridia bacterium]